MSSHNLYHLKVANRLRCRRAMLSRQARLAAYSKSKAPSIPIETGHHFRVDTSTGSGRCPPIRLLVWGGLRYRLEQNARALPSDRQVDGRNRPLGSEACKPALDPMLSQGASHRMTAVRRKEPVANAGFPAAWFDEPWSLSAAVRLGRQSTQRRRSSLKIHEPEADIQTAQLTQPAVAAPATTCRYPRPRMSTRPPPLSVRSKRPTSVSTPTSSWTRRTSPCHSASQLCTDIAP